MTFPLPEEASASLLLLFGNILSIPLTYGMQILAPLTADRASLAATKYLTPAWALVVGLFLPAVLVGFTFRGEYKRTLADDALPDAAINGGPPCGIAHAIDGPREEGAPATE